VYDVSIPTVILSKVIEWLMPTGICNSHRQNCPWGWFLFCNC